MTDKILLVEDNADDVFLFSRAVERSRCDADLCHAQPLAPPCSTSNPFPRNSVPSRDSFSLTCFCQTYEAHIFSPG